MRAASMSDVPALHDLQARWETTWLGAPEESENEVREHLERVTDLEAASRVLIAGGRIVGAGLRWEHDTWLGVDPDVDADPLYADLLPWFAADGPRRLQALDRDEVHLGALAAAGWTYAYSSVELTRDLADGWRPQRPSWPDGVRAEPMREQDVHAIYDLVYRDARWSAVPGHPERSFDDWRSLFVSPQSPPDQQVLAWDGDRLVGVASGRVFDDATGWVAQLAVAESQRRRGLGRALLLAALHRRIDAGATTLGLSVQAENRGALRLYLDAGLTVDREWRTYVPG